MSESPSEMSHSLSPLLLPDNATGEDVVDVSEAEQVSDSSIISEHLNSNSDSVENDRSYQEIEISNVPSNFSLLFQNLSSQDENISQEIKPTLLNTSIKSSNNTSLNSLDKFSNINIEVESNIKSILDEILRSEQFKSDSENSMQKTVVGSNESSFNLFEGIDLNDSLINDYALKSHHIEEVNDNVDQSNNNVCVRFLDSNPASVILDKSDEILKVKQLEELLNTKDIALAALTAELESLRELTSSNHSTLSLNTSTTDYKLYHDEFQNRIVEFQNALSNRDSVIQQLTEALQQSVINREQLQEQSEHFSREIIALQKQLAETSAIFSQHRCDITEKILKDDAIKSVKDNSQPTVNLQTQNIALNVIQNQDSFEKYNENISRSQVKDTLNYGNFQINQDIFQFRSQPEELDPEIAHTSNKDNKVVLNLKLYCSKLEDTLNPSQMVVMNELKNSINLYVQCKLLEYKNHHHNELKILEDKLENEKMDHEIETAKLRQLLASIKCDSTEIVNLRLELDAKHARELEELRTYFEQKCADLEKHYSEEVFSQQSRKMSDSSSSSESTEFIFSDNHPRPGPGGDNIDICIDVSKIASKQRRFTDFSKKDIIKLKNDLSNIVKVFSKYNIDNISKQEIKILSSELNNYDLHSILKYDLLAIKSEMQNKYHAELEILREDYENRIDVLDVEHSKRIQYLEKKYLDQIESLKFELDEALRNIDMHGNTTQEVASSGEYELAEVVQSYERRLQEQVTLAKIDIINALEHQIQMLVANTSEDAEWPIELLQLRNRFTEKYEKQLADLEQQHHDEIVKLKEEHLKLLNGALERARRKSLRDSDVQSKNDMEIIKERDNLKKTTSILRQLIRELMKYFGECEEELNNTLVDELLKFGFTKNLTELEPEINLNESSNSTCSDSLIKKQRVHLAPKFDELIATIDSSMPSSLDSNISVELKNELGACLQRLRADANAVLALSTTTQSSDGKKNYCPSDNVKHTGIISTSLEDKISSLTKQLIVENQMKNDLADELCEAKSYIRGLELERSNLDGQVEQLVAKQKILESDLNRARQKISELIESGHKEIVSEGYGENSKMGVYNLGIRAANLTELQERAKSAVAECSSGANQTLVNLVEELCREGDRITEEAKNDHADLEQQIEAADKKLRATCHFLEEQAAEREQERDEAQKEIIALREQLRERDKDRVSCERISKEVDHLEQQMREMSNLIQDNDFKYNDVEAEKNEAIEKVFVLRDIIRDLENQVEIKTKVEIELRHLIVEFEGIIKQQNKTNEELNQHLGPVKNIAEAKHFQKHIEQLEDEVQRLRLNTELAGSEGAVKQIKSQLNEFEINIDKRTRDLEALHSAISTTSCSSPSEDMSLRDQIHAKSPSVLDECDMPLQQLARLKEKLFKHSRAEDAAVKRIRDLEMELASSRHDLDEVQNERDILQDQVSEQLVLISSLQMRLDDQRLRAEQVQKQTNTSLEVRIYDLENDIKNLMDSINAKDKTIKQLNKTVDETKKRLQDQEKELSSMQEDKVIAALRSDIRKLHAENTSLLTKINNDAQNAQVLPSLVDNILADKNKDIDQLRQKLDKTQTELNTFLSLNIDHEQLKVLSRLQSSERAFGDILSLTNLEAPETMRRTDNVPESLNNSMNIHACKRNVNETVFISSATNYEPEISSIELIGQPNINYSAHAPLSKPNSTEIHKSVEKRVHFDDSIYNAAIEKLQAEVLELKNELFARDEVITEYTNRLTILSELELSIQNLQQKLNLTEDALTKATETFEKEQNELKEYEKNLRIELAEQKMYLIDRDRELKLVQEDSSRKDRMYIDLAKEKRDLEKTLSHIQKENEKYTSYDNILMEKDKEIQNLKRQLTELSKAVDTIKNLELDLHTKQSELQTLQESFVKLQEETNSKSSSLNEFKEKLAACDNELKEKEELNIKITKDLKNKEAQFNSLTREVQVLKDAIERKNNEIETFQLNMASQEKKSLLEMEAKLKEMKILLTDRETEIEILNEDTNRYQEDILKLENKVRTVKSSIENEYELKLAQNIRDIAAKDLEIIKLSTDLEDCNREIRHLHEVIAKKERIVNQMSDDSKSLHTNLETIQNKMQEAGNVVDLKQRLEFEQNLNANLKQELNAFKAINSDYNKPGDMTTSIEEITGAVRKQLDYSAHLDHSILNALATGDSDCIGTQVEINDIDVLKQCLVKEKNINFELNNIKESLQLNLQELEQKYLDAQRNNEQIHILFDNEKKSCHAIQIEDANMLEQLRIRLETALNNETELEKLLDAEKLNSNILVNQIANLKQLISNISSGENSKTELTEYKSLPNGQSQEIDRLRNNLQLLEEENAQIKTEIKNTKKGKSEIEANLKYTKDMLQLKHDELQKLNVLLEQFKNGERAAQEMLGDYKTNLEQRKQEVENSRILLGELEHERQEMKREIIRLNENLKSVFDREAKLVEDANNRQMNQAVPEKFLHKMRELGSLVKEYMKDNQQMSDVVTTLTDERKMLQDRIKELEDLNNIKLPFDDPVARANHLFARYLRSESYRKALVWQKRYLVVLLASYQTYPLFSKELPIPARNVAVANHPFRSKGVNRFKAVVVSIIAVIRMQFLVQRWHSGKRAVRSNRYYQPPRVTQHLTRSSHSQSATQFHVGQPVSSQNFPIQHVITASQTTNSADVGHIQRPNFSQKDNTDQHSKSVFSNEIRRPTTPTGAVNMGPWSGITPPSKDPISRSKNVRNLAHHSGTTSSSDIYSPLQAPTILSQYIERFDQIQSRLGMASEDSTT